MNTVKAIVVVVNSVFISYSWGLAGEKEIEVISRKPC